MAHKTQLSPEITQQIINLYVNKQYGQLKVAKLCNVSDRIVKRVLQENNIHIRTFSEAAKISNKLRRKYDVNDYYFDEQTPNMAYLLGFIAADGTVSKDSNQIKIGLSSIDRDFLEKIKTELNAENPIFDYTTNNGFNISELKFSSERIKHVLAEYNIIPRKTYSFTFPTKLKKEFYKDFIRGYFDGDGSVSTAGASIRFQICANQSDVLEHIIDYFNEYDVPKVNIQTAERNGKPFYYFQYSTNATKQIYTILYYTGCFCLPRKYEKYKSLM